MTYLNREHLLALADRCEVGAEHLAYEGEHAAEVLAERAGGAQADPQEWAARKTVAAAAARQYAQNLRAEAETMREGQRVPEPRIREAEKVADAANLGGILIDSRRLDTASSWDSPEMQQATRDYAQAKADTIERTGMFDHVADNGQVPFWQLGRADQAQDTTGQGSVAQEQTVAGLTAQVTDADADGM